MVRRRARKAVVPRGMPMRRLRWEGVDFRGVIVGEIGVVLGGVNNGEADSVN